MGKRRAKIAFMMALLATLLLARQSSAGAQQVPDAPSATRPTSPFPAGTKPAPKVQGDRPTADGGGDQPPPAPPPQTHEPALRDSESGYTIPVTVNFVNVPVLVKDSNDRLVDGLVRKDFSVYENGEPVSI